MRIAAVVGLVAVAGSVALYVAFKPDAPQSLRLDEYLDHARAGDVRTATIGGGDRVVTGQLQDGTRYRVGFPVQFGDELTTTLREVSPAIELSAQSPGSRFWTDLASMMIPLALLAGARCPRWRDAASDDARMQARTLARAEARVGKSGVPPPQSIEPPCASLSEPPKQTTCVHGDFSPPKIPSAAPGKLLQPAHVIRIEARLSGRGQDGLGPGQRIHPCRAGRR